MTAGPGQPRPRPLLIRQSKSMNSTGRGFRPVASKKTTGELNSRSTMSFAASCWEPASYRYMKGAKLHVPRLTGDGPP
jgi:hypothetical protein